MRQRLARRPLRLWSRLTRTCRQRQALYGPRVRVLQLGGALAAALHRWFRVTTASTRCRRCALGHSWRRWVSWRHLAGLRPAAENALFFGAVCCRCAWKTWRLFVVDIAVYERRLLSVQYLLLVKNLASRSLVRSLQAAFAVWWQRQATGGWVLLACAAACFGVRMRRQWLAIEQWRQHRKKAVVVQSMMVLGVLSKQRRLVYVWRRCAWAVGWWSRQVVGKHRLPLLRSWRRFRAFAKEVSQRQALRLMCHAAHLLPQLPKAFARWRCAHGVHAETLRSWAADIRCIVDARRRRSLRVWHRRCIETRVRLLPLLEAARGFSRQRTRRPACVLHSTQPSLSKAVAEKASAQIVPWAAASGATLATFGNAVKGRPAFTEGAACQTWALRAPFRHANTAPHAARKPTL